MGGVEEGRWMSDFLLLYLMHSTGEDRVCECVCVCVCVCACEREKGGGGAALAKSISPLANANKIRVGLIETS